MAAALEKENYIAEISLKPTSFQIMTTATKDLKQ